MQGVLKKNQVKPAGARRLGASATAQAKPHAAPGPRSEPQARIVQQNRAGAIVEVTCGCGEVIRLQCVFQDSDNPQQ